MKYSDLILIITTTSAALMAGFFFSFSVSINAGLGRLSDSQYLRAMQSINKSVQNPIFFIVFFSAVLLLPCAAFLQWKISWISFCLLLSATIFYVLGVFFITIFFNVPLNNKLEIFNIASADTKEIKIMRNIFEDSWNNWNFVRTISSITCLLLIIVACFYSYSK